MHALDTATRLHAAVCAGVALLLLTLLHVMQGSVSDALQQLQQEYPLVLQGHACSDEVQFHLRCQQYIEYIRYIGS